MVGNLLAISTRYIDRIASWLDAVRERAYTVVTSMIRWVEDKFSNLLLLPFRWIGDKIVDLLAWFRDSLNGVLTQLSIFANWIRKGLDDVRNAISSWSGYTKSVTRSADDSWSSFQARLTEVARQSISTAKVVLNKLDPICDGIQRYGWLASFVPEIGPTLYSGMMAFASIQITAKTLVGIGESFLAIDGVETARATQIVLEIHSEGIDEEEQRYGLIRTSAYAIDEKSRQVLQDSGVLFFTRYSNPVLRNLVNDLATKSVQAKDAYDKKDYLTTIGIANEIGSQLIIVSNALRIITPVYALTSKLTAYSSEGMRTADLSARLDKYIKRCDDALALITKKDFQSVGDLNEQLRGFTDLQKDLEERYGLFRESRNLIVSLAERVRQLSGDRFLWVTPDSVGIQLATKALTEATTHFDSGDYAKAKSSAGSGLEIINKVSEGYETQRKSALLQVAAVAVASCLAAVWAVRYRSRPNNQIPTRVKKSSKVSFG